MTYTLFRMGWGLAATTLRSVSSTMGCTPELRAMRGQGRFSFYITSNGEEATAIGSAAALTLDDVVCVSSAQRDLVTVLWTMFPALLWLNALRQTWCVLGANGT